MTTLFAAARRVIVPRVSQSNLHTGRKEYVLSRAGITGHLVRSRVRCTGRIGGSVLAFLNAALHLHARIPENDDRTLSRIT